MMLDMFSIFDFEMFSILNYFNWVNPMYIMLMMIFIINLNSYSMKKSFLTNCYYIFFTLMWNLITKANVSYNMKIHPSLIMTLYLWIMLMNLIGLAPHFLSISSHMMFSMSFGFSLWTILIISSLNKSLYSLIASMLPSGTPMMLAPFLVLVETVSTFIAPLTLSFRLMANMTAGHIVLSLISSIFIKLITSSNSLILLIFPLEMMYFTFEIAISLIQAYIFCLLLILYLDNHSNLMTIQWFRLINTK